MFESVGWVSLPKYSGYAMGYGLEKNHWSNRN
jgi:NTE family protein